MCCVFVDDDCNKLPTLYWLHILYNISYKSCFLSIQACLLLLRCLFSLCEIDYHVVKILSCYCKCSVPFPHGAVGWSAVCDCGIFCTNSLF